MNPADLRSLKRMAGNGYPQCAAALAEIERLTAELAAQDRVLRSSVPERHKGCTSPVGAVQSYIVDLEGELEAHRALLPRVLDEMRADWWQIESEWGQSVASPEDEPVIAEVIALIARAEPQEPTC